MKKGWQTKTLGEVCDFQRGLTYSKGDEVDFSDNVVLRAMNIDLASHLLDFSELKYISDKVAVPESKKVKLGSLMICTASGSKSHLGKIAFIDEDYGYAFGGFMGMLTPSAELVPKYLFHLMTSGAYEDFIGALADGMNINNLKFDELKQFQVPYPPLAEQHRIVGILDEAFAGLATAKANAEKNLHNARALFESHLQSVFSQRGKGWVEMTIEELCDIKHGYAFDGADFSNDVPDGNPLVVTPGNFTEDGKLLFNQRNTKRFSGSIPAGFQFDIGDLVVVMTDLSSKMKILGKPAFVETDDVLHNQRIGRLVFSTDRVEKRLLYYFMMTEGFLKNIKLSSTGTMVKHTAPKRIMSNVIPFPDNRKEQRAIISKLDDLREETQRLAAIYQQKLAALESLKKSLLHQAFSGEL
jgi:type I restriction enzyme S subunit